jgi:transcriptional/translational regulatory protein YebC/TACO1
MVPKSFLSLEKTISLKILKLMENLEDLDDVQKVFTNIDITDEIIESFETQT